MKLLSVLLLLAVVAYVFASVADTKQADALALVDNEIGATNHVLDKRAATPTRAQRVANHRAQKLRRIRARKLKSIRARKAKAAAARRARRNKAARRG